MLTDPPGPDLIEISIFGPGKGESVAVHLGHGDWIIVDSCVDQATKTVPVLEYLRRIGVDVERQVKLVVGTHADDDHFAGIAQVFEACKSSLLVCSSAITTEEFHALVELDKQLEPLLRASALSEYRKLFRVAELRGKANKGFKPIMRALQMRELFHARGDGAFSARVCSLSPSDEAVTRSLRALARSSAVVGERRKLFSANPNELSVALWIEAGGKSILLGADLLIGPAGCGWGAILANFSPSEKAVAFKVPHHGSPNAHHEGVWTHLLADSALALLAPYRGGVTPRPSPTDRERICALTPHAYITASPDMPPPPDSVRRAAASLGPLAKNVREPWGKAGHVRARSTIGETGWSVDWVHPARRLCVSA